MAGMILTQYGQISREHSRPRTGPSFDRGPGTSGQGQAAKAIEQLRAHYGLTPHGLPDAGVLLGLHLLRFTLLIWILLFICILCMLLISEDSIHHMDPTGS